MYQDKIYNKLQDDNIRNKIINGQLQQQECNSEKVYHFLKLLKRNPEAPSQRRISESVSKED